MIQLMPNKPTATLARALASASLLGLAAASIINPGSAQAATCNPTMTWADVYFPTSGPFSCNVGDKLYSDFSTNIAIDPALLTQAMEFSYNPINGIWDVNANFDPDKLLNDGDYFQYKVTITDPNTYFAKAFLGWTTNPSTVGSITKTISDAASNALLATLTTNPSAYTFTGGPYTSIVVRDQVPTNSGGFFDNVSNNFAQTTPTPAPLPLLGAAAALGFSRQLRKRIGKHSLA